MLGLRRAGAWTSDLNFSLGWEWGRLLGSAFRSHRRRCENLIKGANRSKQWSQVDNQKQVIKETKVIAKEKEVDKTKFKTRGGARPTVSGWWMTVDPPGVAHLAWTLNVTEITAVTYFLSFFLFLSLSPSIPVPLSLVFLIFKPPSMDSSCDNLPHSSCCLNQLHSNLKIIKNSNWPFS